MVAQTLPMAAMFLRNKMLSWSSVFLAVQSYLAEPINKPVDNKEVSQPPLLRVIFAIISLVTCYIDIIFPSTRPAAKTVTQKVVENVAESIVSATSS